MVIVNQLHLLSQCEIFCKHYNLPLHFSLKKKHCCCRNDIESSEPGYVVIWDKGDSGCSEAADEGVL